MSTTPSDPLSETLIHGTRTEQPCPHGGCDGYLDAQTDDDGNLTEQKVCPTCNHTPDGTYVAYEDSDPDSVRDSRYEDGGRDGIWPPERGRVIDYQISAREMVAHPSEACYGGERPYDTYNGSGKTTLYGGYETAYPHEKRTREGELIGSR